MTTATATEKRYEDGADVGDILVATWGYDQTNASWFRVERRTEKSVWLVELVGRTVRGEEGFMQGHEVPTEKLYRRIGPEGMLGLCSGELVEYEWNGEKQRNAICGKTEEHEAHQMGTTEPFRKGVKHDQDGKAYVKMTSYMYAHPWSGNEVWVSWYA